MQTLFTLKLEADGGTIRELIADGLRIARRLEIRVETEINGVEVSMHPLDSEDEVRERYLIDRA
tara:strand:- start:949 stop:1140 length:192 start_codon:yes stop_codon:yes gene_type:complete